MKFKATLQPAEFDQRHPAEAAYLGYRGIILGKIVRFGTSPKYEAILDDDEYFDVLGAPCVIKFEGPTSLKCDVEIDDEIIFMLKRYGKKNYDELVKLTVNELAQLV